MFPFVVVVCLFCCFFFVVSFSLKKKWAAPIVSYADKIEDHPPYAAEFLKLPFFCFSLYVVVCQINEGKLLGAK